MLGRLYENQDCSAARALEVVGERWSLLILRDAMFANYTRFSQFQKGLGIATNILAKRLEDLVLAGIMERRQTGSSNDQAEYLLTRKGVELKPAIMALTEWGDKWVRPGPIEFRDAAGRRQRIELQLRRVEDDTQADVADVVVQPRLSMPGSNDSQAAVGRPRDRGKDR